MAPIYAITLADAGWLGNAPAVAGGWVMLTDCPFWSEIVRKHTGRRFLATMSGLSEAQEVPCATIDEMIAEWEAVNYTSKHPIIQEAAAERERWIAMLQERMDRNDARRLRERQLQVDHGLSIQESEVVAAIEAGERVGEIAERLGVTTQAVSKARRNGYAKLRPSD